MFELISIDSKEKILFLNSTVEEVPLFESVKEGLIYLDFMYGIDEPFDHGLTFRSVQN